MHYKIIKMKASPIQVKGAIMIVLFAIFIGGLYLSFHTSEREELKNVPL